MILKTCCSVHDKDTVMIGLSFAALIQRNIINSTMKDFVLSLLSRGYGQIVPNEDGHDGRLEVYFEPQVNISICLYKTSFNEPKKMFYPNGLPHSQLKHDLFLTRITSTGNPSLHCCVLPAVAVFLEDSSLRLRKPTVQGEGLLFCIQRTLHWHTDLARLTGRERLQAAQNRKLRSSCTHCKT